MNGPRVKKPEEKTFVAGQNVGINVNDDFVITGVDEGSLAESQGVKEGWSVMEINNEPFSMQRLIQLQEGTDPFFIRFQVTLKILSI